jgi:hypothetical protein
MTPEQRYWRAIREAMMQSETNTVLFLAGKLDVLPSSREVERKLLIEELAKALDDTVD